MGAILVFLNEKKSNKRDRKQCNFHCKSPIWISLNRYDAIDVLQWAVMLADGGRAVSTKYHAAPSNNLIIGSVTYNAVI